MKEYWINVYKGGYLGLKHHSIYKAIVYAYVEGPMEKVNEYCSRPKRPIYRIHVKPKLKIGGAYISGEVLKQWTNAK